MKGINIHLVNMALMFLSLVIAVYFPFQLFLFAYAVLGPLHYLTEIPWLHQKKYFTGNKNNLWIFLLLTCVIILPGLVYYLLGFLKINNDYLLSIVKFLSQSRGSLIFAGLLLAAMLVYHKRMNMIMIILLSGCMIIFFYSHFKLYYLLTGIMLPTLIHVYFFTLFFISYGVVKSKSIYGAGEVLMLLFIPIIIYFLPLDKIRYSVADDAFAQYIDTGFKRVNTGLGFIMGIDKPSNIFMRSSAGIRIQIFIAFAYLYHYLNWFSKVSLIGWMKNTSGRTISFIFFLWLASVAIYWYDYKIGLSALFFLSLLHVILEFPLNIVSIRGVGLLVSSKLKKIVTSA
jgi:hypothetical protein